MAVTDPPGFTVLTLGRNYQSIGDSPFSCSLWEAMLFELQVTNLCFFCFDSVARNHSFNVRLLKQSLIDYGPENHQEQYFSCPRRNNNPKRLSRSEGQNMNRSSFFFSTINHPFSLIVTLGFVFMMLMALVQWWTRRGNRSLGSFPFLPLNFYVCYFFG